MTTITIEYRVMDGWDNKSEISTRRIYIYESRQFDTYAFFATPTDASGAPSNNSTIMDLETFLTSARRIWMEMAVTSGKWPWYGLQGSGSKPDSPAMKRTRLFMDNLSTTELSDRLSKLKDSSALMNVRGLKDFNATVGL